MADVIEIYADTKGRARCRGQRCGAWITWAEVVNTGAKMCFDGRPEPLSTREDLTGRAIEALPFESNHWASCPDREQFKRGVPHVSKKR